MISASLTYVPGILTEKEPEDICESCHPFSPSHMVTHASSPEFCQIRGINEPNPARHRCLRFSSSPKRIVHLAELSGVRSPVPPSLHFEEPSCYFLASRCITRRWSHEGRNSTLGPGNGEPRVSRAAQTLSRALALDGDVRRSRYDHAPFEVPYLGKRCAVFVIAIATGGVG